MRRVLASYLNESPAQLVFKKAEQGKPFLDLSKNSVNLQFNLTHTEDIALLAVGLDAELGIDIEHKQRNANWQGMGKRFLTQSEQRALFVLDSGLQQEAFFDLWTRKEAYIKVLGCGLALAPTQFSLSVAPQKPALLEHHSDKFKPDTEVVFTTIALPEDCSEFCATLAVLGELKNYTIFPDDKGITGFIKA